MRPDHPSKSRRGGVRIIRDLDPNGESILKALEIIFKCCIENGQFPNEWKKANVVPVHKKK